MPYQYRLKGIHLQQDKVIDLTGDLTVLVGPNNCGKSRILKDILALTCGEPGGPILGAQIYITLPKSFQEVIDAHGIVLEKQPNGNRLIRRLAPNLEASGDVEVGSSWPENNPAAPSPDELKILGPSLVTYLSTSHRLRLVAEGNIEKYARGTILQQVFHGGDEIEKKIRTAVCDAFPAIDLVLDTTLPPAVVYRVGDDFSGLPSDRLKRHDVLKKHSRLDDQGDGIRSYAGIAAALLCTERPVVLIDEPEAFLHPPQAYRLGRFIASMATATRQIIVATHSVDVLRGLVADGKPDVIRLERVKNATNICRLENNEIKAIYLDPLLSNAGVLNGIFFSGVVVTEADADSRFFGAISAKMDAERDLHFINADNKQTVPKILETYRKMGVRAVGMVDIDVLNDHKEFSAQLDAAQFSAAEKTQLSDARKRIETEIKAFSLTDRMGEIEQELGRLQKIAHAAMGQAQDVLLVTVGTLRPALSELREKASEWSQLKKSGRECLGTTKTDFDVIYEAFKKKGIFINPAGELEASLVAQEVPNTSNKKKWIRDALTKIPGLNVDLATHPWKFFAEVHKFLDQ